MDKIEWYSSYDNILFRAKRRPDKTLFVERYDHKYNMWVGKSTWKGEKSMGWCALHGSHISEAEALALISQT